MNSNPCGCGRSPTGQCIGWHALDEEAYRKVYKEYLEFDQKVIMKDDLSDWNDDD